MENSNVPYIKKDFFNTLNESELRTILKGWCKTNLVGKTFTLHEDNFQPIEIQLTWQGIKNDIFEAHPPYIEKLVSFGVLSEIIEKANFLHKEPDKRGRREVKFIHKFISGVKIGDILFDVILIIYELIDKSFVYDHILLEKK